MYAVRNLENINSISHQIPINGHTQNEGDNAHSLIERNIKRSLTKQYVTLIKSVKKSGCPYKVKEMWHENFELKALAIIMGFTNVPKNSEGEPFEITEVKIIKVEQNNPKKIMYKNGYNQGNFQ